MVALDVVQPQQFYDSMKRLWIFLPTVEKELQMKTLHWVPGKLRITRQLSSFVLEHSIDASFRGIWYLDSPVLFIHSLHWLEDAE